MHKRDRQVSRQRKPKATTKRLSVFMLISMLLSMHLDPRTAFRTIVIQVQTKGSKGIHHAQCAYAVIRGVSMAKTTHITRGFFPLSMGAWVAESDDPIHRGREGWMTEACKRSAKGRWHMAMASLWKSLDVGVVASWQNAC